MKVYAAYYDNKIRLNSSSGGVFSRIASKFDVVYGVALTADCYGCEFVRIEGDISSIRGSKYLQAKVGESFKSVKKDLLNGKSVLFSGTGCQINGLSLFLGKEYPNLFLLDVICHGVPSPKLWKEYVEYQEKKYGKVESVNFRCKDESWQNFGMKENHLYIPRIKDPFMTFFLSDLSLRPSCYACQAKNTRMSDMTIADFWGIEEIAPEMDDGKGTSLIITRTNKGQNLFDSIEMDLRWKEVNYEDGVRHNVSEFSSVAMPQQRDSFFTDMNSMSFKSLSNKYIYGPLWKRIGRKIKHTMQYTISNPGETVRKPG